MTKKDKENACIEFYEMIQESWTWARLTEEEQKRFRRRLELFDCSNRVKGSYESRWEQCNMFYNMFLAALDYKPFGWREEKGEQTPLF